MCDSGSQQNPDLVGRRIERRHGRRRVECQVAMAEHHALRFARRARGVKNRCQIVQGGKCEIGRAGRVGSDRGQMPHRLAGNRFGNRLERQKLQTGGQFARHGGQLLGLLRAGNDHEPGSAVANLLRNLRSGERIVHGDVNAAGQVDRQVAQDPLVAIFAGQQQAVAGREADGAEPSRHPPHVGENLVPGKPVILSGAP